MLSRKKAQSVPNSETKSLKREDPLGLGEEVDLQPNARYCLRLVMVEEACLSALNDDSLSFLANKLFHKLPKPEGTL